MLQTQPGTPDMTSPWHFFLQVALAAVPSEAAPSTQTRDTSPLVRLESLRGETSRLFTDLRDARASLRAAPMGGVAMQQGLNVTDLVAEVDQYVDYFLAYHQAQDAVVDAVDHAYFTGTPSCGATTQQIALSIGGAYAPGETFLVATYLDVAGQSTVVGTSGGAALAPQFSLLPVSQSFNAQGGAPAFNNTLHYYSATLTGGAMQSGLAVQLGSGPQSSLVLYPDAILGTSVFAPSDLALLRWFLLENPTVPPSVVFDFLLVPFDPPVWGSDGLEGGVFRQDINTTYLCCRAALAEWKTKMTEAAYYFQAWEKQIADRYGAEYTALQDDIKSELGSHGVDVVMNDGFILDLGGMSMEDFKSKVDAFQDRKAEIDGRKNTEETNLKNGKANAIAYHNGKLRTRLLACLQGWEQANAIADEIVARAIDLIE